MSSLAATFQQPPPWSRWHDILSALAYTCGSMAGAPPPDEGFANFNDIARFLLRQQLNLPDYLGTGMRAATAVFDVAGLSRGGLFHHLPPQKRKDQVLAWKNSSLGFQRDLIRYYESLSILARLSPDAGYQSSTLLNPEALHGSASIIRSPDPEMKAEVVIIGSGPGGAITACLLAEAGRDVLLIEEGPFLSLDSCAPFSLEEMLQKYRHGGQTVALGRNKVAYVEGRCVGGGSEINSGLYHRTPPEILESWRGKYKVQGLSADDLLPHFEQCERDLSVCFLKAPAPTASLKLHKGATRLGWKSIEVPRWIVQQARTDASTSKTHAGTERRQSMTETYIPRFLNAGGRLLPGTRAAQLRQDSGKWMIRTSHREGIIRIAAQDLFLAGGAVQTPALLLRSGIRKNIGRSLEMHPTVKVVARFPDPVNSADMGVPVHQVKEFAPRVSFGCSISSPAYLGLGLIEHPGALRELGASWTHMANYYLMSSGASSGAVRLLPRCADPLVQYNVTETGMRDLAHGLRDLCRLLLEAGANRLYPGIARAEEITSIKDLDKVPKILPAGAGNLMTIHLFSSCPMGEDKELCAADSFGRVHGFDSLYISDASLLCSAPGVNPQGSIMAIARRNALAFLSRKG
jgi:choline dehydrogenase-like flavoprotein